MSISIIHPSRKRPLQALLTSKKWLGRASTQVEYILSIDDNDPQIDTYRATFKGSLVQIIVNKNRSCIDAINNGAKLAKGNVFVVVSDDFDCPQNWDFKIYKATEGKTDWILKVRDGIQGWIITLPIMDRAYYERFGYIYHPDYLHMFADTHMSCVADILNKRITTDIEFTHLHYSVGKSPKDEVNIKADNTWSHGERLFLHHAKNKFFIPDELAKGRIMNDSYVNWIKARV